MSRRTFKVFKFAFQILVAGALLVSLPTYAAAQTSDTTKTDQSVATAVNPSKAKKSVSPLYSDYRGIKIGMTADEVRSSVDHLKERGDRQDFFVFSDNETAQVFYDKDHHVRAVSIDYLGADSGAPTPEQVLGQSVQANADGSMYSLMRYADAGYWVSYNRTGGDNPTVTITMQKM